MIYYISINLFLAFIFVIITTISASSQCNNCFIYEFSDLEESLLKKDSVIAHYGIRLLPNDLNEIYNIMKSKKMILYTDSNALFRHGKFKKKFSKSKFKVIVPSPQPNGEFTEADRITFAESDWKAGVVAKINTNDSMEIVSFYLSAALKKKNKKTLPKQYYFFIKPAQLKLFCNQLWIRKSYAVLNTQKDNSALISNFLIAGKLRKIITDTTDILKKAELILVQQLNKYYQDTTHFSKVEIDNVTFRLTLPSANDSLMIVNMVRPIVKAILENRMQTFNYNPNNKNRFTYNRNKNSNEILWKLYDDKKMKNNPYNNTNDESGFEKLSFFISNEDEIIRGLVRSVEVVGVLKNQVNDSVLFFVPEYLVLFYQDEGFYQVPGQFAAIKIKDLDFLNINVADKNLYAFLSEPDLYPHILIGAQDQYVFSIQEASILEYCLKKLKLDLLNQLHFIRQLGICGTEDCIKELNNQKYKITGIDN